MVFRLSRLPVNWRNQPQLFERYWDETLNQIEKTLNAILDIPAIEAAVIAAQTAADTAQNAAEVAQTAADTAQNQVSTQSTEISLVNSYVSGFTGSLISATSTGDVTIISHTRVYGDPVLNPDVSVSGATISTTGSPGDIIRVYYIDAARSGGSVTYQYIIDGVSPPPVQTGDTHSVGVVEIPVSGVLDGKYIKAPGYVEL